MFIRTWLYAIAFGVVLASSVAAQEAGTTLEQQPVAESGQGNSPGEGNETAQPNIANGPAILAAIEGIETAIRDLIAEEDNIEADRQRQNESRDLDAQEAMAKWARWMYFVTLGTAAITFVGLILIGLTLCYTRRAAIYTKGMLIQAEATTKAAQVSADQARADTEIAKDNLEIVKMSVRPYLFIEMVSNTVVDGWRGKDNFRAAYSITNHGSVPASVKNIRAQLRPVPSEIDWRGRHIMGGPIDRQTFMPDGGALEFEAVSQVDFRTMFTEGGSQKADTLYDGWRLEREHLEKERKNMVLTVIVEYRAITGEEFTSFAAFKIETCLGRIEEVHDYK